MADGQSSPIDFYRDYIRLGELRTGGGEVSQTPISAETLNAHRNDPRAEFVHRAGEGGAGPVAYATLERQDLTFVGASGDVSLPFIFLSYHFVFRESGLPLGLARWQAAALGLMGDLRDWHQLDHYTAVTMLLDADHTPVAVTFQQHNYQRTHLLGETLHLGTDQRLSIDAALRSNELYPHRLGRHARRAVRFLTPAAFRFMLGGGPRPWMSADDVTQAIGGYLPARIPAARRRVLHLRGFSR